MTYLSVNINKIATLRNSRGGDLPDVIKSAIKCQLFGADGITIHPRPDQRHITRNDVYNLKEVITKEYNIEGYPSDNFLKLVIDIMPTQVTLVPDASNIITSNNGWDTVKNYSLLKDVIKEFKKNNIRTSIFINPKIKMVEGAKLCGTDRVELYTEDYATNYSFNKEKAIAPYLESAKKATEFGLGINAGHDLSLENLEFFAKEIPDLEEVSIGHALISDAIYLGLENTIQMYKRLL
jgi:pyridoxine 5-phosphate synthase|tara:strand:+ start:9199 stop:9909 length:711 start_codon:yes stop_codon:yes gene_type:complete